jgi:exonuclease III
LHIIDFDEKKIWADPQITAALESMKTASLDSVMPLLKFRETAAQAQTLTIVHHNTQSLPAHIQDLKRHHELSLSDVLCLTETHLTGSFVADSLQLDGYTMFSRNRHVSYAKLPERAEQNGGGVAVYVRDYFQASEKRYLHNVTNLEFVAVKIESPVKLLIAAVYRPPHYGNPFMENLKALLDSLEVMDHQPIVVCGDFNEDLLNGFPGPITRLLESRGYAQLIKEATTEKNTLLDHMYISRPQQCLQSGVLRTYYSYHNPVYCVLSTEDD